MSNFFTSSELTSRAYNGIVSPEYQAAYKKCAGPLLTGKFKDVGEAYKKNPPGFESSNLHKRSDYWVKRLKEYDTALEACLKKEGAYNTDLPGGLPGPDLVDFNLEDLLKAPYIYIIAATGMLIVGVLIGRAIK